MRLPDGTVVAHGEIPLFVMSTKETTLSEVEAAGIALDDGVDDRDLLLAVEVRPVVDLDGTDIDVRVGFSVIVVTPDVAPHSVIADLDGGGPRDAENRRRVREMLAFTEEAE